uniref:Uncharacterized protein n=1 Tax=Magallana gigas TaxID=29159 RepID=A0A8W8IWC9_MAGGI
MLAYNSRNDLLCSDPRHVRKVDITEVPFENLECDTENEHRPTQATATDILLVDEDDAYREQLFPFPVNKEITVQSIPAVEPTATPSDHDYCSYGNEKAQPQTCNAECQTNLTLQDMEKSEAELLQLRETFRDKDDLKRYLLVDKMTDSDSSVKSYFGLPSVVTLFGIFAILDNLTPTLAYWKDSLLCWMLVLWELDQVLKGDSREKGNLAVMRKNITLPMSCSR